MPDYLDKILVHGYIIMVLGLLLFLITGCAEYEVQGRAALDRAGALELRGPCLVRAGTIERLPEVKRKAVRAYTPIMCQKPE